VRRCDHDRSGQLDRGGVRAGGPGSDCGSGRDERCSAAYDRRGGFATAASPLGPRARRARDIGAAAASAADVHATRSVGTCRTSSAGGSLAHADPAHRRSGDLSERCTPAGTELRFSADDASRATHAVGSGSAASAADATSGRHASVARDGTGGADASETGGAANPLRWAAAGTCPSRCLGTGRAGRAGSADGAPIDRDARACADQSVSRE